MKRFLLLEAPREKEALNTKLRHRGLSHFKTVFRLRKERHSRSILHVFNGYSCLFNHYKIYLQ